MAVTLWLERNPLNRGTLAQPTGRSSCKFHGITCGHNPAGTEIWGSSGLLSVGEQRQGQINQSMGWINQFDIGWKQLAQHGLQQRVMAAAQDDRLNAGLQKWLEIPQCCLPQLRCIELMGLHSGHKGGTTHLNDG